MEDDEEIQSQPSSDTGSPASTGTNGIRLELLSMEDDGEIQSQPSPDTGSPASPGTNGRITVPFPSLPPHPHDCIPPASSPPDSPRTSSTTESHHLHHHF
ncbi:hypothetical protein LOK49_LG09G01686 [Camellia lanceoleosa]|uniref:Uncharacterized protein n=1 Tax=Camellia lanceoleosa TaxID=1840588 RepID=A0ACC0GNZ9_9ERIC|nr:hypothetical protein LOK49_LG09G01686 [Camellia lanceoleosa]